MQLKSKFLIQFGIVTVISLLFVTAASAQNFGTFPYWYSNKDEIGYFKSKAVKIYSNKGTIGMTDATFNSAVNYSLKAWESTLKITASSTGTASSHTVAIYGQHRNVADSFGIPVASVAYTLTPFRSNVGSGTYNQMNKNVYDITQSEIYFIWDTSNTPNKTSSFSTNKWKAIAAHEGGHAAGYTGHDAASSSTQKSIMNPNPEYFYDSWGVSVPQPRDIYHTSNVY